MGGSQYSEEPSPAAFGPASGPAFWAARALVGGACLERVRIVADAAGLVSAITPGAAAAPGDTRFVLIAAGLGNGHSHAFHWRLRGRTNAGGGDFWRWRETMYREAASLTPTLYQGLATGVFGEMLAGGYTAVGEFHYLHHRRSGAPYDDPPHAMELALARAATAVGIRLVLLDTCYLAGGIGQPLEPAQQRFSDGDAAAWLRRHAGLQAALAADAAVAAGGLVTLGAAVHSVRAVPRAALDVTAGGLAPDEPLHVHLSEQPAENEATQQAYGLTPAELLDAHGLLAPRTTVVHATHLTSDDVALLGQRGVSAVFCPTTEADLGDGIGPAVALDRAGVRLAVGSDQNVALDGFGELRWLEYGQRLAAGRRGLFTPAQLWGFGQANGYGALGLTPPLSLGGPCDFVELDPHTSNTRGARLEELVLVAGPGDIGRVVVGGQVRRP